MEGWIDECEREARVGRRLPRVPPDHLAAIAQAESLYVQSSTLDSAGVRVREEDFRFGPERGGGDSENTRAAAEVDDSFRRLVPHESRKCFEQELTSGIELLRAEYAGQGFDLEFETLSVDGFDGGEEGGGGLTLGSRTCVLLEANDARPCAIDDDDWGLVELCRESFDG